MYCMQPSSVLVFCKYTRKKLMQEIMDGIYIHAYASLVPSPTPSFFTVLSSDEKLGVGLGTRLCICIFGA